MSPYRYQGVECVPGFVNAALDVFVLPSIFPDFAARVNKLVHFLDIFSV